MAASDELRQQDPVLEAFEAAPLDDEPVTEEEEALAREAWAEYERGESAPLDESCSDG
jgi:hypothetical protein